eukprot:GILJ01000449.1.p1 GENE.GILJ01000449.1~~GILJ01000449.1.p1  ORF type:complete len:635 (+),score=107.91 GILJ01000449.1:215-2119(+)
MLELVQSGFEGAEKKLELVFTGNCSHPNGLRSLTKDQWSDVLSYVNCLIMEEPRHSDVCDAYLLSESSLFVYSNLVMIKTCGTTKLLNFLPRCLELAAEIGLSLDFVRFSRSNFRFPKSQPFPHCSFHSEVSVLDDRFQGSAKIIGPLEGPRWYVYTASLSSKTRQEIPRTTEIVMRELDPASCEQFFVRTHGEEAARSAMAQFCAFLKVLPGAIIHDFTFDPCGYSVNGLINGSYFTLHVTPEVAFSYASFEINDHLSNHPHLLEHIFKVFRPKRVSLIEADDCASPIESELSLPHGYLCAMSGRHDIGCGNSARFSVILGGSDVPLHHAHAFEGSDLTVVNIDTAVDEVIKELNLKHEPATTMMLSGVARRVQLWHNVFSRIRPFYTVKSNADPSVIGLLSKLGCCFDAAAKKEVSQLLQAEVEPSRVMYTSPAMLSSHIKYAASHNVELLCFDNDTELFKIHQAHPKAHLILGLAPVVVEAEELHFGASVDEAKRLLALAKSLGLRVVGVSLPFGRSKSMTHKPELSASLSLVRCVFEMAMMMGIELDLVYLGGGLTFLDDMSEVALEEFASALTGCVRESVPDHVRVIAAVSSFFAPASPVVISMEASEEAAMALRPMSMSTDCESVCVA